MKKLSIVLAVPLIALAACNGGGEAGNNAQANGADAANAAGDANEAAPAGGDTGGKPADGNAVDGGDGGKPADGNAVAGEKPTGGEAGNEQ